MSDSPIFEALAAETVGTTMGLPVWRYPNVRTLRAVLRYRERMTSRDQRPPRATLQHVLAGETWGRMHTTNRHSPDL